MGADSRASRVLEIIEYFKQGTGGLRIPRQDLFTPVPCVQHLPKPYRVEYCQYGAPYNKPMHLSSKCSHLMPRLCTGRCCFLRRLAHMGVLKGAQIQEICSYPSTCQHSIIFQDHYSTTLHGCRSSKEVFLP